MENIERTDHGISIAELEAQHQAFQKNKQNQKDIVDFVATGLNGEEVVLRSNSSDFTPDSEVPVYESDNHAPYSPGWAARFFVSSNRVLSS